MQINQSQVQSPSSSFMGLSQSGPLSTSPDHPWARYQTTRDSPSASEPAEIIQTSQSCLLTPPHLFLSIETTIKALAHISPHSFCLILVISSVALNGGACPILLGRMSNKLSSQWWLSPDLLASPDLNNKTYILKHSHSSITYHPPHH